jgi:hypothetical protein
VSVPLLVPPAVMDCRDHLDTVLRPNGFEFVDDPLSGALMLAAVPYYKCGNSFDACACVRMLGGQAGRGAVRPGADSGVPGGAGPNSSPRISCQIVR